MGWGALVLAIVVAILFGLAHGKGSRARHAERRALRVLTPAQVKTNGYTSSASCRACHPSQYESWHKSYHRTMTQLAGPHSVMGQFDGTEVKSRACSIASFKPTASTGPKCLIPRSS